MLTMRRQVVCCWRPKMELPDLLTSLPTSLSCAVLKDWLTIKSVVALDSAYCAKSLRDVFLDVVQSKGYFIREKIAFYDKIPAHLSKFVDKLRRVVFRSEFSRDHAEQLVQRCHDLTHVYFDCPGVINFSLWELLNANPNISCFHIKSNVYRIGNLRIPSFKDVRLPHLSQLSLRGVNLYGHENWLDAFKIASNIVRLDLSGSVISQPTLAQIPHFFPHLTALGLAETGLSDEVLSTITASCPRIAHLNIAHNSMVTDDGVLSMAQNSKGLRSLCIKHVTRLTDASLVHILTHCASTLHTIVMDMCEQEGEGEGPIYSGEAINNLLEGCRQLQTLHLGTFPNELGTYFEFTPAAVSNLETIVLSGEVKTDENLTCIGKYAVKLRLLSLYEGEADNYVYVQKGLKSVCFGCPQLQEIYLRLNVSKPYTQLAIDLWQALKPELLIKKCMPSHLAYDVLNVE